MPKKAFLSCLLFLACTSHAEPVIPEPFSTDGCSIFPDGNLLDENKWLDCCVAHDLAYWQGGTYMERLKADQDLMDCVAELDETLISLVMMAGVRVGGSPFFPTTFRWGYGWPILRGYKPLSTSEKSLLEKQKTELVDHQENGF